MKFNYYTDKEILKTVQEKAKFLRVHTIELLDVLTEINKRKLYCDLAYSSLFQYIVDELKFSPAQASIYNSIVKANILELQEVKNQVEAGTISLFALGHAAHDIRAEKVTNESQKKSIIETFSNLSKNEIMKRSKARHLKNTHITISLSPALTTKLEKLKSKLKLPEEMDFSQVIELLVDKEMIQDKQVRENKSVTPSTKKILKSRANHQCEYRSESGKRCQETKFLEIDHRYPKALGGTNHPENLRVLCREHNQRSAMNAFKSSFGKNIEKNT